MAFRLKQSVNLSLHTQFVQVNRTTGQVMEIVPPTARDRELDLRIELGLGKEGETLELLYRRVTVQVIMAGHKDRNQWAYHCEHWGLVCTEVERLYSESDNKLYAIVYSVRALLENIEKLERKLFIRQHLGVDAYPRIEDIFYGETTGYRGSVAPTHIPTKASEALPTHYPDGPVHYLEPDKGKKYLSPAPSPGRKPKLKKSALPQIKGGFLPLDLTEEELEEIKQRQQALPTNPVQYKDIPTSPLP